MTTSAHMPVQPSDVPKPWRHLALIAGLTVLITPLAAGFWIPIGPASHVQLPGVLIFVVLALTCVFVFMRCPARPIGWKIAALGLTVPSLYLAVDTVLMFLAFGLMR